MIIKIKSTKHFIPAIIVVGLIVLLIYSVASRNIQPVLCNGFEELCNKRIDEIAFATTHNAMDISEHGWFAPSHDNTITDQLNSGVRGLMLDTHYYDVVTSAASYFPDATPSELVAMGKIIDNVGHEKKEGVFLCHILCQLGSTPINDTLTEIKIFLDDNPYEVIVIIFEDRVIKDDMTDSINLSGLTKYVYSHKLGVWPTLGELIHKNKRLVIMSEFESTPPDWYHHAWDYTEETPYSFSKVDEMTCAINRGDTGKDFFLLNNWVEKIIPSRLDAAEVNNYDYLLDRSLTCAEKRGFEIPNFIAVNFSDQGDVFRVVNTINEVEPRSSK